MSVERISSILRSYALKNQKAEIGYNEFLRYLDQHAEKLKDPFIQKATTNPYRELVPLLSELRDSGFCVLIFEKETIKTIIVNSYYRDLVAGDFRKLENSPDRPLPTPATIGANIPKESMHPINVKTDFVNALNNSKTIKQNILLIQFPGDIQDILVPKDMIKSKLIEYSVQKIGLYLKKSNNKTYMQNKLLTIFKGNERVLNDTLDDVMTKPKKAQDLLNTPNNFSFQFWTHIASFLLQDLKNKREKLVDEHGFCQAAYLIGFFVVYQKGMKQREKEKRTDLKQLDQKMREPPFVFTIDELHQSVDSKGVPFKKKYSARFLNDYLQEKMQEKGDKHLPTVVRAAGSDQKGYFMVREKIIPLFLKELAAAAIEMRKNFVDEWMQNIHAGQKDAMMNGGQKFITHIEKTIADDYPLLSALINTNLLFLAKEETEPEGTMIEDINKCFTRSNELKPVNELLGLDAKAIFKDAKSLLPFWETVPFVRQVVGFFKALFKGPTKAAKSTADQKKASFIEVGEATRKASRDARSSAVSTDTKGKSRPQAAGTQSEAAKIRYKKAIKQLEIQFVGSQMTMDRKLADLAERWNPLLDPKAKRNLVEDVNSMMRDFIRSLRKSFSVKPPDAERIRNLAMELSKNKNLVNIKKRDFLRQYIEIYMIKCLDIK